MAKTWNVEDQLFSAMTFAKETERASFRQYTNLLCILIAAVIKKIRVKVVRYLEKLYFFIQVMIKWILLASYLHDKKIQYMQTLYGFPFYGNGLEE